MKDSKFYKVLLIISIVLLLLTAGHVIYDIIAYRHASVIQFIAKEMW